MVMMEGALKVKVHGVKRYTTFAGIDIPNA